MCGVPVHAAQDYLKKLISLGHRVAICEQVEDPAEAKKRGGKSPVRRDVVRLVTRGTITEDDLLPARASNYLAALAMVRHGEAAISRWPGPMCRPAKLAVLPLAAAALADELARIDPAELLLYRRHQGRAARAACRRLDAATVDARRRSLRLHRCRRRSSPRPSTATSIPRPIRASNARRSARCSAISASRRRASPWRCVRPRPSACNAHMAIDAATRASLELLETQRGTAERFAARRDRLMRHARRLAAAGPPPRRPALRSCCHQRPARCCRGAASATPCWPSSCAARSSPCPISPAR